MQILKIIIFVISNVGYYLYLKQKIKEEFIPIIIVSCIGVVEYIAGILNLMVPITIIIGIVGSILFFKCIYKIIRNKEKIEINKNCFILIGLIIWSIWRLKGVILIHYDNFSHWALIVKDMIITNRLPNFQSTVIAFNSYPPGTACFIYFVCKYLGNSESIMLFAQSLLILSSLYTLFSLCNKNSKINYIIVFGIIAYILISNIFITDLLVDTVLPVMGISGLLIILYYKNDSKKGLLCSIPILTLLMLVKNSGMFFVVIDLLIWIIIFIKNNGIKNLFKEKYILILFLPIIVQILWNAHIKLVFDDSETTKHSMSVQNYVHNIENKETSDINIIFNGIIEKMTNLKNNDNKILLLNFITYIIMIIVFWKNKELRNANIKFLIFSLITYILYQISLLGMYCFSMPGSEAIHLAGYERYFKTMVTFEVGVFTILILYFTNKYNIENKYKRYIINTILLIIMFLPLFFYEESIRNLYIKTDTSNSIKETISNCKKINNIEEQKSYLIYVDENYNSDSKEYLYYICNYEFRSPNVKVIRNFSELTSMDEIFEYDYFIINNKTDEVKEFIKIIEGDINTDVIRFR